MREIQYLVWYRGSHRAGAIAISTSIASVRPKEDPNGS